MAAGCAARYALQLAQSSLSCATSTPDFQANHSTTAASPTPPASANRTRLSTSSFRIISIRGRTIRFSLSLGKDIRALAAFRVALAANAPFKGPGPKPPAILGADLSAQSAPHPFAATSAKSTDAIGHRALRHPQSSFFLEQPFSPPKLVPQVQVRTIPEASESSIQVPGFAAPPTKGGSVTTDPSGGNSHFLLATSRDRSTAHPDH